MSFEIISSRKNRFIIHLRSLASDGEYRREHGEYLCDGRKLLTEALEKGAEVKAVLWRGKAEELPELDGVKQYCVDGELFDYASPMKNSPGPVFCVSMPETAEKTGLKKAILLENVQDPGNVGTVIRTAAALGTDTVILCGDCADVYSPKTARATMGAIFRERIIRLGINEAAELVHNSGLRLYGAALSERARDIRELSLSNAVVAVGSEGRGLSEELLSMCDGELIIPMTEGSESLNAAVAASIVMWETNR